MPCSKFERKDTFEGLNILRSFEVADKNAAPSILGFNYAGVVLFVDDLAVGEFGVHSNNYY